MNTAFQKSNEEMLSRFPMNPRFVGWKWDGDLDHIVGEWIQLCMEAETVVDKSFVGPCHEWYSIHDDRRDEIVPRAETKVAVDEQKYNEQDCANEVHNLEKFVIGVTKSRVMSLFASSKYMETYRMGPKDINTSQVWGIKQAIPVQYQGLVL